MRKILINRLKFAITSMLILLFCIVALQRLSTVSAHDPDRVHGGTRDIFGISSLAIQNRIKAHGVESSFAKEIGPDYSNTNIYWQQIRQGSVDEDYDGYHFLHHGYNPYTDKGWSGVFPSGKDYFIDHFTNALLHYHVGKLPWAYWWLGRSMHILQDMAVPAHAHAARHALGDDYEAYVWNGNAKPATGAWPSFVAVNEDDLVAVPPYPFQGFLSNPFRSLAFYAYGVSSWGRNGMGDFQNVVNRDLTLWKFKWGGTTFAEREFLGPDSWNRWYVYDLDDWDDSEEVKKVCDWYNQKLVPKAVSYSAGLLDEFWKRAHGEGPPGGSDEAWPPDGTPDEGTGMWGICSYCHKYDSRDYFPGRCPRNGPNGRSLGPGNCVSCHRDYAPCLDCHKPPPPPPPLPPGPGGDHPDDNNTVAVGEQSYGFSYSNNPYSCLLRTGIKKEKPSLIYLSHFVDELIDFRRLSACPAWKGTEEEIKVKGEKVSQMAAHISKYSLTFEEAYKSAPDVAILDKGFSDVMSYFLQTNGEYPTRVGTNFSPDIVKNQKVLILPSGALALAASSELFQAKLADYVNKGGTVICLAQQHGSEYRALPLGGQLLAYGWREDQSCQSAAVYIDTYHQMLSGLGSASPCNVSVDGYFSSIPDNSTILLSRTKNGMPALISYPYGKGRVIAGTIYTDWAYGMDSATSQEQAMLNSIISWAKSSTSLPEGKPSEEIATDVLVKNITDATATAIKLTLLDPNKTPIKETTISAVLPPDSTKTCDYSYVAPSTAKPGIYYVDYTLLDSKGQTVQPEAEGDALCGGIII